MIDLKRWTEDEENYLIAFSQDPDGDTIKSVAKFLGRTEKSVRIKLSRLRKQNPYVGYLEREWTEKEIAKLKVMHRQRISYKEIGKQLGRTEASIQSKIIGLGLSKRILHPSVLKQLEGEIRRLAKEGYTRQEIANIVGLEYKTIKYFILEHNIDCKKADRVPAAKQRQYHSDFMRNATRRYK